MHLSEDFADTWCKVNPCGCWRTAPSPSPDSFSINEAELKFALVINCRLFGKLYMHNSLLTGEKEPRSQRWFSTLTPDTQVQNHSAITHWYLNQTLKPSNKAEKFLRIQYRNMLTSIFYSFLKMANKSKGVSDFLRNCIFITIIKYNM